MTQSPRIIVLISANAEWRPLRRLFPNVVVGQTPFGEWFVADIGERVVFVHGGWGKIAAAASTQYAIDRWSPELLVNLGTCGGFEGECVGGDIIVVERTVVYDIVDQMGNADEELAHYATDIDLGWLGDCGALGLRPATVVSADRDLVADDIPTLRSRYGGVAADWESGAIAYVAGRNGCRCLIVRGVSDIVGVGGGEAYGNEGLFVARAEEIVEKLVRLLPAIIARSQ